MIQVSYLAQSLEQREPSIDKSYCNHTMGPGYTRILPGAIVYEVFLKGLSHVQMFMS